MSAHNLLMAAAGASGGAKDTLFNHVTALLHGDGTNGAQNNSFVDSSSQALTIARNGNPTQGSFTPYGDNWSTYFSGANYIYTGPSADYDISGVDFTIEFWFNWTKGNTMIYSAMCVAGNFQNSVGWQVGFESSNVNDLSSCIFQCYNGGWSTVTNSSINATTVPQGTWHHIAIVRNGSGAGNLKFFLDGVNVGGTFNAPTYPGSGGNLCFGVYQQNLTYAGNPDMSISNFRLVKGTAVYSANFTPPTTPLTAITNTKFLGFQNNRWINNGTTSVSFTTNGSLIAVQRFGPFLPTVAYSTGTVGGSAYFDGSGDYLRLSNVASQTYLGSGDWTLECWVYYAANHNSIFVSAGQGSAGYNHQFTLSADSSTGTVTFGYNQGNGGPSPQATGFKAGCWNHVAVVRNYSANNIVVYVNGVGTTTTGVSGAGNNVGYYYDIGQYFMSSYLLNGYISNLRQVTGVAVYSGNFTPPTAPLATSGAASAASYPSTTNVNTTFAASATQLLVNGDNAGIYDNAMMNDWETVGNAQVSTTQKKFGTASLYFDGTGDYLVLPAGAKPNFKFGVGDFTIEFWAWKSANGVGGYDGVIGADDNGNATGGFAVELSSSRGFVFYNDSAVRISSNFNPNDSTWHHYAVVRSSGTMALYKDGVQLTTAAYTGDLCYSMPTLRIGSLSTTSNFNGYIDDLRVTKGYARYTGTFTPPSAAFPDQ